MLLIMETIVGTVFGLPQESVQNRATYTRESVYCVSSF